MTVDQPRLRVNTNTAFGICLVLLGTTLMLDRLQLLDAQQDAEATIEMFALMGGVTIFVPEDWQVDVRATPIARPHSLEGITSNHRTITWR